MAYLQARRDFLKIASATSSFFLPGTLGAQADLWYAEDKSIRSICEMCSSRCFLEARIVNGKVINLQGNPYAKESKTSLCAKGVAGISQLYDKERLIKPLIRVGKRGENLWREASYEEAIELIATRLSELQSRYGAQSVIFSSKTGESYEVLRSFASVFGSPNIFSHWSSCPIAIETALEHTFGERVYRDFENANYILNFGHNLFEGIDITLTKNLAQFAADTSKKLVVFDPRFSVVAAKADEWYPIKAGSDLALVLSLLHVWIRDGKYNKAFIERYTTGFDALKEALKDATPRWQATFTGIDASVVERIAAEVYRAAPKCIIDWGHKSTTSPAEYQRTRAILIANVLMGNVEREGGIFFAKTPKYINALSLEENIPVLQNPFPRIPLETPRLDGAGEHDDKHQFVPKFHGVLQAIPEAILEQKPYAIKGWFLTRHNPLITVANPQKMKEAMENLEFIVVNDIYLSDTAMMADVVLPEATYLERDEGIASVSFKAPQYALRNRSITPLGNTKSFLEIMLELSKKMGYSTHFPWKNVAELRAYQAKGNTILLETLLRKGVATFDAPALMALEPKSVEAFCERYPKSKQHLDQDGLFSHTLHALKTPSHKIEIFCEAVEKSFKGYGVPCYADMDVKQNYPYVLMSGKSAVHTNGHTQNVPYLNMLMSESPVWMHPSTAQKHGLKQGDTFYVQNAHSKEKAVVFITEGIRPDTLFVYMGFGRNTPHLSRAHGKGFNPSKLLSLQSAPICGAMITNSGVDIVKG